MQRLWQRVLQRRHRLLVALDVAAARHMELLEDASDLVLLVVRRLLSCCVVSYCVGLLRDWVSLVSVARGRLAEPMRPTVCSKSLQRSALGSGEPAGLADVILCSYRRIIWTKKYTILHKFIIFIGFLIQPILHFHRYQFIVYQLQPQMSTQTAAIFVWKLNFITYFSLRIIINCKIIKNS